MELTPATHTLYAGAFIGADGTRWDIAIVQNGGDAPAPGADTALTFPADTPAEIDWSDTAKTDPLCGSALTLRVVSDSDRRFLGLYRTTPGEVGCRVMRDGALYWAGLLDTELYEEPWAYARDYDVQLTFSDLGQLKRFSWTAPAGFATLREVVEECLRPLLGGAEVRERVRYDVSTRAVAADGTDAGCILDAVVLDTSNFADLDSAGSADDADTLHDVLEAALQPWALRVEQRGGVFRVYDLHALEAMEPRAVRWEGTDATLGVDKVYNNVCVTFSPNVEEEIIRCSIDHDDAALASEEGVMWTNVRPTDDDDGYPLEGFRLAYGRPAQQPAGWTVVEPARMFRLDACYSGSDCAGVAVALRPLHSDTAPVGIVGSFDTIRPVMRSRAVHVRARSGAYDYRLRVSLDMLLDALYNPFERDGETEEKLLEKLNRYFRFVVVPAELRLLDKPGGRCLYHYENYRAARLRSTKALLNPGQLAALAGWREGDYTHLEESPQMLLSYYSDSDRKKSAAIGGWATNRPPIGLFEGELPEGIIRRGTGEIIDLPPVAGWLELTVLSGPHNSVTGGFDLTPPPMSYLEPVDGRWASMHWLLYRNATVELCTASGRNLDADSTDDVEYSAWLLPEAEEGLEISTRVGSAGPVASVGARGVALLADGSPLRLCERAGVRAEPEKLLIATAYSQHASRHLTLSGLTAIEPALATFADAAMPEVVLMRTGCVERLREAEADSSFVELSAEHYTPDTQQPS